MTPFFTTENLQTLLKNNPDSLVFAHLGARLIDEGEYQDAIRVCSKGLEKHPEFAFGHFILGTAHFHIKNYTDAKKELEKALALDPNNPRAWEILTAVNEILNLSDDSRRSNLQSYLIDSLNREAASNYLPPEESPSFTELTPEEKTVKMNAEKEPASTETEEIPEKSEENLEELLDSVVGNGEEEYDFEKALDEVFRNKESEAETPDETSEVGHESEELKLEGSEKVPQEEEDLVSAEELTSGMESIFDEIEEQTPAEEFKEEDTEVSDDADKMAASDKTEIPEKEDEDLISEDFFKDLSMEQEESLSGTSEEEKEKEFSAGENESEIEELTLESEESRKSSETEKQEESPEEESAAEKSPDDEFMDFKEFVSGVIQETHEDADIETESQELPELTLEEETEERPEQEDMSPEQSVDATEFLTEEDFDAGEKPPEEAIPEQFRSGKENKESEKQAEEKKTEKTGKPPILSPTLGEIYIAQGRFEEAIDVFNRLLEKDPENTRFQRKIDDLKKILAKKKMGSS